MQLAGTMIDSGQIEYALIVDGEGSRPVQERTLARLLSADTTVGGPLLRLRHADPGLGRGGRWSSARPTGTRRATCSSAASAARPPSTTSSAMGDMERMVTDSKGLLLAGLDVAEAAWKDAASRLRLGRRAALRHAPGIDRALRGHARSGSASTRTRPADVPDPRQHRPGRDPDHAGDAPGQDRARATACSCWAWARASTPPPPRSAGEPAAARAAAGSMPALVPEVTAVDSDRRHRAPGTSWTPRRAPRGDARAGRDAAVRPRQPELVLPVAPARGRPPAGWRVIAVDHLDMGFSERTGTRATAGRSAWTTSTRSPTPSGSPGRARSSSPSPMTGAVPSRWAGRCATSTSSPASSCPTPRCTSRRTSPAPSLIRAARLPGVLPAVTSRTRDFIRGGLFLSRPVPPPEVRKRLLRAVRQGRAAAAIEEFVEDIPLEPEHPSAATLDAIADGLGALADVPVLLLWGPRDPVFSDLYLRDLIGPAAARRRPPLRGLQPLRPRGRADLRRRCGRLGAGPRQPVAAEPVRGRRPRAPRPPAADGRCGPGSPSAPPTRHGGAGGHRAGADGVTRSISFAELRRPGRRASPRGWLPIGVDARRPDRAARAARRRPDRGRSTGCWRPGCDRGRGRRGAGPARHADRPAQRRAGVRDRRGQGPRGGPR